MDLEILKEFINEADEILTTLSVNIHKIETDPYNRQIFDDIYRGFHTLKGAAGFLSLQHMIDISHACEKKFSNLNNKIILVDERLIELIIQALDALSSMIEHLKLIGKPSEFPEILKNKTEDIIKKINNSEIIP